MEERADPGTQPRASSGLWTLSPASEEGWPIPNFWKQRRRLFSLHIILNHILLDSPKDTLGNGQPGSCNQTKAKEQRSTYWFSRNSCRFHGPFFFAQPHSLIYQSLGKWWFFQNCPLSAGAVPYKHLPWKCRVKCAKACGGGHMQRPWGRNSLHSSEQKRADSCGCNMMSRRDRQKG